MVVLILVSLITGVWLYKVYQVFKVPDTLNHLPRISIGSFILSLIRGERYDVRFKRLIKPTLETHGCGLIWVQGQWEVMISNPLHAREILSNIDAFPKKSEANKLNDKSLLNKLLGTSNVIFSDGDEWLRHRKVINPAFKKAWDTQVFGEITIKAIEKINNFGPDSYINIATLFQQITLDALGKGLFSYDFEAVKNSEGNVNFIVYHKLIKDIGNIVYFILPWLETLVPSRIRAHENSQQFRIFLQGIITERRNEMKTGVVRNDLLTRIIQASIEAEEYKLTDEEVINDLTVLFLAGHDTTASTLTTMFHYLSKSPEIQERAYNEVMLVMNHPSKLTVPTAEQIKGFEYIDCIIKESMRIMPTISVLQRFAPNSVTLSDGFQIPANTHIGIQNWGIHHDQTVYPNPYTFNPDRFKIPRNNGNNQWMGFGFGSRMCVAMNFSLMEQKVIISLLLQHYHFKLHPQDLNQPLKLTDGILIRAPTVNIQFQPR